MYLNLASLAKWLLILHNLSILRFLVLKLDQSSLNCPGKISRTWTKYLMKNERQRWKTWKLHYSVRHFHREIVISYAQDFQFVSHIWITWNLIQALRRKNWLNSQSNELNRATQTISTTLHMQRDFTRILIYKELLTIWLFRSWKWCRF